MKIPAEERFKKFVALPPAQSACMEWLGSRHPKGYGLFYGPNDQMMPAHRFSYELFVGPIPPGLQIDHLCRNRACVRPDHLEPVTNKENGRRGLHGMLTTHCPQGHPYNEANTYRHGTHRYCRACINFRSSRYQKARRQAERVVVDTELKTTIRVTASKK